MASDGDFTLPRWTSKFTLSAQKPGASLAEGGENAPLVRAAGARARPCRALGGWAPPARGGGAGLLDGTFPAPAW
jgi:hypothetical protein